MRILFISQYFQPEVGAGVTRVAYTAKYLANQNHEVTVIAGTPNYPTGKVYKGYKNSLFQREVLDKQVGVVRTFVYPTRYTSMLKRLLNYTSFALSGTIASVLRKDYDLVVASSPPLSVGFVGLVAALVKNKPLVFDVRDVWPGAAVELGVLTNKAAIGLSRWLETAIYKKAKFVIAPTQETKELLLKDNYFLDSDKVRVVSNGVDLEVFGSQLVDKTLAEKFNLKNRFVVLYSGTLGLQQGVRTFLECVGKLKKFGEIAFLVLGEGASKDYLTESKKKHKLGNLILLNTVEYKYVPSYISSCNVGLALLKKNRYQDAALAVKVFDYFAGKKPVIVSGGLAMKKLIEETGSGFWVPAEDPAALADKILEISKMPKAELGAIGKRGRKLAENEFNREKQAEKLLEILSEVGVKK